MILLLFSLKVDFARFMGSVDTTYCEIYWSQPYSFFEFSKDKGIYSAKFMVKIDIINNEMRQKVSSFIPKKIYIQSPEIARARHSKAVDVIPIFLLKGFNYKVILTVIDSLSGKTDSSYVEISTDEWSGLKLSDIQLSHTIREGEISHPFVKNGYFLIPYPEAEFTRKGFLLAYYAEGYGLIGDSIQTEINILSGKSVIKEVKKETTKNPGGSMVIAGGINLLGLPYGEYSLQIKIKDGNAEFSREKSFTIVKKEAAKFVRRIPEKDLEYAMFLNYLLKPEELSLFSSLSDSAKIIYVERFWGRLDPTPETPENEALSDFINRVKYADEHFSRFNLKGRYTEMGRILIKYGIPDEVLNRTFETGVKPYIIWYYQSGAQMEFVFVDMSENGNFELVYSSVKDEPYDPNWQSYILPEDRMKTISR